ncbi:MAG TPA: GNAT family N-acetyltransferase [Acidobacteriota bacterium]|nr:GNAT family N-acetyltransferase [Acidobacteriota bacterium]
MIRPFQPEDASACFRIIRACLQADASYPPALQSKFGNREASWSISECARLFYVAVYEDESRILGFAGLDLNEIRLLYIDPVYQRRGIGRRLFEHLKEMVPGTLFPELFVYSTLGAVGFYESCGFKNKGPFVFDAGGIPLPTVFMSLPF